MQLHRSHAYYLLFTVQNSGRTALLTHALLLVSERGRSFLWPRSGTRHFGGGVPSKGSGRGHFPRARATIPKTAPWLDVFVDFQLAATRRNKGKLIDTPRLAHGTWPQGDDRFPGGPQTTRKTDFHKDFASKTHPLIFSASVYATQPAASCAALHIPTTTTTTTTTAIARTEFRANCSTYSCTVTRE